MGRSKVVRICAAVTVDWAMSNAHPPRHIRCRMTLRMHSSLTRHTTMLFRTPICQISSTSGCGACFGDMHPELFRLAALRQRRGDCR